MRPYARPDERVFSAGDAASIADVADRKKISRSAIAEATVASFLSPDAADQREAAFARRLDRMSRQLQRLERDLGVTAETLALFVRFWLTITPPIPPDTQASAQAKGRERFERVHRDIRTAVAEGTEFLERDPKEYRVRRGYGRLIREHRQIIWIPETRKETFGRLMAIGGKRQKRT